MIYYTELEGLPIHDAKGEFLGRIQDLTLDPNHSTSRVASYLVKTPKNNILCITHEQLQSISPRSAHTSVPAEQIRCYAPDEGLLRVKKEILDQQIIDVNNRKVVRVNDVDFDIQPSNGHTELRVLAVNVGWAGAVRRLLQGTLSKHRVRWIAGRIQTKTIPWEFVNLIEPDPARRVRLRISYDRLAKMHPADIADILEELSRDDQKGVIESMDDETAAQALSEIPTRMQVALLESIQSDKAANIVEEMPPDEAADVLHELSPETSADLLANMEKDEAKDVRELLGFEEHTAGALMTKDFVMVGDSATVEGAVASLRHFEGPIESIHVVYLINDDCILTGAVPLARIVLADASTPLKDLSSDPVISVEATADETAVVDLFHKYNLLILPVVDDKGRLLGIVTADDALEVVVNRQ
jgi:magnesium transporter